MSTICEVCGLPKELCVCKAISRERKKLVIRTEKRKFGRVVTIIEGVDKKDLEELAKKLKSKLACGGTVKSNKIELQGDHRTRIKPILCGLGFSEDMIEIR